MKFPWQSLQKQLLMLDLKTVKPVTGGDINSSFSVRGRDRSYFVKFNPLPELLSSEARNLQCLSAGPIRTPLVIYSGVLDGWGVLVLEHLALEETGDEFDLGLQLAQLHRQSREYYGLDYDNFIGSTRQINACCSSWCEFWQNYRLKPQLQLAAHQGFDFDDEALLAVARDLLVDHQPLPSLLHGDLWSGNKAYLADTSPVIFDPACYYGDRETDIAFTRVFGGFGRDFYRAYEQAWPLPEGASTRQGLYNLYHLLNHLNLFGAGYLSACQRQIVQLMI